MTIKEEQEILNKKLAQVFKIKNVKVFNFTGLGNSISSGYSMFRTTKPILLRNESLNLIMEASGIKVNTRHFARAQNNGDEHIYSWLTNNVKLSEIHKLNRVDYSGGPTSMKTTDLKQEEIEEYYPINIADDIGLKDAIIDEKANVANIVVYNGCTGSFLDAVTRSGKITQQLLHGFNRDILGLEATLKYIQISNREKSTNTQVYICGIPNFLGLNLSSIVNSKIKKICDKYANVVYVEEVKTKFFYKPLSSEKSLKDIKVDIHLDEEEYLKLNNNILKSVAKNYSILQSLINVDRKLFHFSKRIELVDTGLKKDTEFLKKYASVILIDELENIETTLKRKEFLEISKKYLIERFPYDFYYVGKENLINSIKEAEKK